MSAGGVGGTGRTGTPELTRAGSSKKAPSIKTRTVDKSTNTSVLPEKDEPLFREAPADENDNINPFAEMYQAKQRVDESINPFAEIYGKKPLLEREENNVLGNLSAEQQPITSEPSDKAFVLVSAPEDKKPETHPSQMQMVLYKPEEKQLATISSQIQPPRQQGVLSRLKNSFKSGLARGMQVASRVCTSLSKKFEGGANKIEASIKADKTVESNDVQEMNKYFKNLGSVLNIANQNVQVQGTASQKISMKDVQNGFKELTSLIKSFSEMTLKKLATQSPASNIQKDPEPPKIEDITDDKPVQEVKPTQVSDVEKKDTNAVVTEDKKETDLNPDSKALEQLENIKKGLTTLISAFMALEKEINPPKSDSQEKSAFDPLNLNPKKP